MFLLFLGLGAASVKAQVRIGGNTAPNGAAMLDLNATDATNNGTKGLALPRVNLTSNTMLLPGVTANLTGMLVYNTTATIGSIGIYVWTGAQWTKVNLPNTSSADSGKILTGSASGFVMVFPFNADYNPTDTFQAWRNDPVTWTKVLDTSIIFTFKPLTLTRVIAPDIVQSDHCYMDGTVKGEAYANPGVILMRFVRWSSYTYRTRVRCYRAST